MKRAAILLLVAAVCLAGSGLTAGQAGKQPTASADAPKPCPFSITGLWKSDETAQTNLLFDFSPKGWVVLLAHTSGALPQDFEVIESVNYKLSTPTSPKRIAFTATRGNDIFPAGTSTLDIIEYSEDSFTTVNPRMAVQTRWVREQTHRYFLTLAGRSGAAVPDRPLFATWTTLDGRETNVDALGVQVTKDSEGKLLAVFGTIPAEIYEHVTQENEEDQKSAPDTRVNSRRNIVLRIELTPAEFERTHAVFEKWHRSATTGALPHSDPYENGLDFLRQTIHKLNQCGNKLKIPETGLRESALRDPGQQAVDYILMIREKNDSWHIPNALFPWDWRPSVQPPSR